MKPAVGQRWMLRSSTGMIMIVEIANAKKGFFVATKVLQQLGSTNIDSNGYLWNVGDISESNGLTEIFKGGSCSKWSYLEGQDKSK